MELTAFKSETMPETALTSFTLYVTHIAIVCGSGIVIDVKKEVIFNTNR